MDNIVSLLFNVVLSLIFFVVKLLLLPIDLLIAATLPAVTEALTSVGTLLNLMASGLGWAISASGIPYSAVALFASYYIFKYTLPINIWMVKLALKWWRALKP